MSCYDSVIFRCTCGESLSVQSKGGPREMNTYLSKEVPIDVAGGILGEIEICPSCGRGWKISGHPVELFIEKEGDD